MQSKTNRVFRVVASIAAGLGLGALQASAQQGTFNLPVTAHWGKAVLEPGIHRVQIPTAILGQKIAYLYTDRQAQMALPISSVPAASERAYIHLVKINGTYYVDAYQSQVDGRKYFFPKPNSERAAGPVAADESTFVAVDLK